MDRFLHLHLPARTVALAASESLVATALLLASATVVHREAWIWLRYQGGFTRTGFAAAIFVLCLYYHDFYDSLVLRSLRETLTRLPEVLGSAYLVLAVVYTAVPDLRLQLGSTLVGVGLSGFGIALVRHIYTAFARSRRFAEPYILYGSGGLAEALATEIRNRPEFGIRLATTQEGGGHVALCDMPANGSRRPVGVILAADGDDVPTAAAWKKSGMTAISGIDLYETITGKVWLGTLPDIHLKEPRAAAATPLQLLGKRLLSVLLSSVLLLLLLPVMGIVALVVWFDSGSPVIFRQRRIGQNGRQFTLFKFRSMRNGDHGPFRPTAPNDERFTRVGRWLRRTRLDELPQLWNILRGDMSFIGPRPFAWEEEKEWAQTIPSYSLRWSVKPGATGWAQIHRGYCATREDNEEKLAYDLFYIKNLSVGLDMLILFRTTKILLHRRGAR